MSSGNSDNVVIIDYGMGNLFSVQQACIHVGMNTTITSDPEIVAKADAIIFPGVGAFGDAMETLTKLGLKDAILEFVKSGKAFMGICLGMQLLFSESEEFGSHAGLNLIKGKVRKFQAANSEIKLRVPQIAWNKIYTEDHSLWDNTPLQGLKNEEYMYFVHSFYVSPEDKKVILCKTNYQDNEYCSGLKINNIFALQFHPEKSAQQGIRIYSNFKSLIKTI